MIPITYLFAIFFFALGTIIASFLGVVVARFGTGESWWSGHSYCDSCGVTLTAKDMVPIFSWLLSRGRCFHCSTRVSVASTIVEATLGTLFMLSYFLFGISFPLLFFLCALFFVGAIVLYDIRHTIIPTPFSIFFVTVSIAFIASSAPTVQAFWSAFALALIIALSLVALHYASRGKAMGLADAPFAFGLSLLATPFAFSGFLYSFWIGALVGLFILARAPKGHRIGIEVPFAPFLAAGFLTALFTGWSVFYTISWLIHP